MVNVLIDILNEMSGFGLTCHSTVDPASKARRDVFFSVLIILC